MALIPCPHCGKEISSYAKRCPGCGKDLTPTTETIINDVVCKECGTHYDRKVSVCPACGEPNPNISSVANGSGQQYQDTEVDYNKVLSITEDEFEGTKTVFTRFRMGGKSEFDDICEALNAEKPDIMAGYAVFKSGKYFIFHYNEQDLINKTSNNKTAVEELGIGAPCRGIFIIVDEKENIKLEAEQGRPIFTIDDDQFLKCCNANKLGFKIFKQSGKSIVINGSVEDQELLIDSLRSLYNYVVDKEVFPDAGKNFLQWANKAADAEKPHTSMINKGQLVAEYGSLLKVYADEFEDRVEMACKNDMTGNPELDAVCKRNDVVGPNINFQYTSTVGTSFAIMYSDVLLRTVIEKDQLDDLAERVSSPCKGMIINIDDGEKIKLMVTEKIGGNSDDEMLVYFELTQEQFLKCCNANSLEFRIFKEDASEPIIIRGSAEDEELLIASIRAIYNITVQEIFPNARLKLQSLIEKDNAKKAQIEKAKKEEEDKIAQSIDNKKTSGIVLTIIGGILLVLSVPIAINGSIGSFFILLLLGLTLVIIGPILIIYSNIRKDGISKADALKIMFTNQ